MAASVTTNFVGIAATDYISLALFGGESVSKGYVTPLGNVKYTIAVPKLDFGNLWQADGSSWNASGTLTYTEQTLTPVKLKINFEHDKFAFENSWDSLNQTAGAMNSAPSQSLQSYVLDLLGRKAAEEAELLIWQSNFSGTTTGGTTSGFTCGTVAGLLKRINDNTSTLRVTGVAFTASTIIGEVQKVYNKIPTRLISSPREYIGMSKYGASQYKQAVAIQSAEKYVIGAVQLDFLGMPIRDIAGLDNMDGIMVALENTNAFVATDLLADFNSVRVIDFSETSGADKFGYKLRASLDTNIGNGAEVVLYKK